MRFHRTAKRELLGQLTCAVIGPSVESVRLSVVLCHGYGAPATDLVPLAWEVFGRRPAWEQMVQFVFPAAPLLLDEMGPGGGRAWWHLDVAALLTAIAAGDVDVLRRTVPEGLADARAALQSTVDALLLRDRLKPSQIVLGGFSQGAMLTTDLALRLPDGPAGLAIFSGSLICEDQWRALAPRKAGLPVLQSHGKFDTILPYVGATWLRDLLLESGLQVEFIEFDGDHTITSEVVDHFVMMLDRLLSG